MNTIHHIHFIIINQSNIYVGQGCHFWGEGTGCAFAPTDACIRILLAICYIVIIRKQKKIDNSHQKRKKLSLKIA